MEFKYDLEERIKKILMDLVAIYTPTGTKAETEIESFYLNWFESMPYFKSHEHQYGIFRIPQDRYQRAIPWCLLKGTGNDTVVLLHHYDVVDTDDYRMLQNIATRPEELMNELRNGVLNLNDDARQDLASDQWIFGRGVADMKGGTAVQMALIERYAEEVSHGNFTGNIILAGLPDEENLSAGGRAAPIILKELKDKYDLNFVLALNSEPTERDDNGKHPKLYVGSVGKIMPMIYVRGILSHAMSVYDGLNPVNVMSEVVRKLDVSSDFIEKYEGVTTCAPTFLYFKDGKNIYDVSLPRSATGYMNLVFLKKTVPDIMEIVRNRCKEAFESAIANLQRGYDNYSAVSGTPPRVIKWGEKVKLYSELYQEAASDSGDEFLKGLSDTLSDLGKKISRDEIDMVGASKIIIERTLEYVKDMSPMIVIALTPPYYPFVANSMLGDTADRIDHVCDEIVKRAKDKFKDEYVRYYMTGMSDQSYFMQSSEEQNNEYVAKNMLLWGDLYNIPFRELGEISMPILSIGPWGKSVHQYDERVFTEDLYHRTPDLLAFAIEKILRN